MPSQDDDVQIWFLTGSQALYGEETLRQVEDQSRADRRDARGWAAASGWSGGPS